VIQTNSLIISSHIALQSAQFQSSLSIFKIVGFGQAFTAKKFLKIGAQENASLNSIKLSIIAFLS